MTLRRTVYAKGPFTVERCGGAPALWTPLPQPGRFQTRTRLAAPTPLLYLVVRDGRRVNAFLKFRRAVNYVKRETAL